MDGWKDGGKAWGRFLNPLGLLFFFNSGSPSPYQGAWRSSPAFPASPSFEKRKKKWGMGSGARWPSAAGEQPWDPGAKTPQNHRLLHPSCATTFPLDLQPPAPRAPPNLIPWGFISVSTLFSLLAHTLGARDP